MNSTLLQAPGRLKAQHAEGTSLPTRRTWKKSLCLAATLLLLTVAGMAQNNTATEIVSNTSLFRPRGIIRAMVANPAAPGGVSQNYWVSDGASGFCRVIPDHAGIPTRDLLNCDLPGVSEPSDYQAETFGVNGSNGYVFVAGIKSIERVEFVPDPANPAWTVIKDAVPGVPGSRVFIYNSAPVQGPTSIFANGLSAVSNRNIEAARMGPDGKLYFIFQGSGDVWRINNPLTPAMSPQANTVERVGTSDNGKTLLSITWIGHDLWMAQAGFLNRLKNADKCNYTGDCVAQLEFGNLSIQEGMIDDQFDSRVANGRWLYWSNGNRVVRYDTFTPGYMEAWTHQGTVLGSPVPQGFTLLMGLNWVQPAMPGFTPNPPVDALRQPQTVSTKNFSGLPNYTSQIGDMMMCMDRDLEAPPPALGGALPRNGRCFLLAASPTIANECQPTNPNPAIVKLTCNFHSQIGSDVAISPSQQAAARRGILLVSGITHPRGLVYLKTNYWVSDEILGFCKIAINPADGSGSLTNCFKTNPAFIPGQPAADPAINANGTINVYVPDASAPGRGVARLLFTPDATGGTVSQTGSLTAGPRTAYAVAMPNSVGPSNDGGVYIGYADQATVNKILTPATAPSGPITVGSASGVGVLTMAFKGNDLYLGELGPQVNTNGQLAIGGQVTVLVAASPSLSRGGAVVVKKALSRLQSPVVPTPQLFVNPGALAIGPALDREKCLPPVGVVLSPSIGDPLVTPALYMGSMGPNPDDVNTAPVDLPEVAQFGSNCTTQIPWVEQASLDPLHLFNIQLGPVTAIAFSDATATASMAIGDDPSTLPLPASLAQKSKFTPPTTTGIGQGHVYIVP